MNTNRMNRRQLLQSMAASAGVVVVAACAPAVEPGAAPVSDAGGSAPAMEPVMVTLWSSYSGANGEAETTIVENFNEAFGDEVMIDYQFQGSYEETAQKVAASLQAQTAPDVSLLSDVWWFKFYLNQTLVPLDDLLAVEDVDLSDYQDSLINEGVRQGVHYWIPFGGAYSDPHFTMRMTDDNTVRAGQFYYDTVHTLGWALPSKDMTTDFINGFTAAAMMSTGSMGGVKANATVDFGTAFLPKEENFGCCTGGAGLAILTSTPEERRQAAMKYIGFASNTENAAFWAQSTGYMPVRKSALESAEMQAYIEAFPQFKTATEQLALTRPQDSARVFVPNGDQIIGAGLERITVQSEDAAFGDTLAVAGTLAIQDNHLVLDIEQAAAGQFVVSGAALEPINAQINGALASQPMGVPVEVPLDTGMLSVGLAQ